MKKNFDCVDFMHKGALKIHAITGKMTQEQQKEYWREQLKLFNQYVQTVRKKHRSTAKRKTAG